MSMPKFSKPCKILTRDSAVNSILTSIAMEESALQTILSAHPSAELLLDVITDAQMVLKNKMIFATSTLPNGGRQEFMVSSKKKWVSRSALPLEEYSFTPNHTGARICRRPYETYISLPGNTKYKIEINLNLHNRSSCPVLVEVRIMRNEDVLMKKRYSYENEENIHIGDEIELASQNGACKLLMRLLTLNKLDIESGIIAVKKITDN